VSQNIYDDPDFFAGYIAIRKRPNSYNEVIDKPTVYSLLPELTGKRVLDLGCGYGEFCRYAADHGAASVVGIELSRRMLDRAEANNPSPKIRYILADLETAAFPEPGYDLVISSLVFHYIEDFDGLIGRISRALVPEGLLLFSIEHPYTTGDGSSWERDGQGVKTGWTVRNYDREILVRIKWMNKQVEGHHRTLETIIMTLIRHGLTIDAFKEPQPPRVFIESDPSFSGEYHRPPFLVIAARK